MGLGTSRARLASDVRLGCAAPSGGSLHGFLRRLLLDSRVVDVTMAYTPTFITLSSLKPFFFNGLQNA